MSELKRPPRVSVVLPAYYSDGTMHACLEGLRAQTYRNFEVIVVNSSPEDRTARIVADFPEVRFEQSPVRLYPNAAQNRGVEHARGELLVFSNPDCRPRPDWLARLIETHAQGHAVVGGGMGLARRRYLERGIHLCKFHRCLAGLPSKPLWVLPTSNACYSRTVWDAIGPFEGEYFAADGLLSWRARQHGFTPWFNGQAIVEHYHDNTFLGFIRQRRWRGEEFGILRIRREAWSWRRAALNILGLPALVLLVLARAARDAFQSGWMRDYIVTLPVQAAGHLAWSIGEAQAAYRYLRGAMRP